MHISQVHICHFNHQLARLEAQEFVRLLHQNLSAKSLLIGDDFRFGSQRMGNFALLQQLGLQYGMTVQAMPSILHEGIRISSTAIRSALAAGDLHLAQAYLGRPYSISGRVIHGDKLGTKIGFPTANIQLKHNHPALTGVFVVQVQVEGLGRLQGVASLGVRPTVKTNAPPVLEVHLFDFKQQLYGKHLQVAFLQKLREEQKYPNLDSLITQIALDVEQAKQFFNVAHNPVP